MFVQEIPVDTESNTSYGILDCNLYRRAAFQLKSEENGSAIVHVQGSIDKISWLHLVL